MTSKLRTGTCTSARSGSHQEYRRDHTAMDIHARFVPNRPLASMDRREERVYPVHDHFEDAYSADGLTPKAYASTLQFGKVPDYHHHGKPRRQSHSYSKCSDLNPDWRLL